MPENGLRGAAGGCSGTSGGANCPPRFAHPHGRRCRSFSSRRSSPFADPGQRASPARRARLTFLERTDGLAKTSAGPPGCPVERFVRPTTKEMVGAFAKLQPVVRHRANHPALEDVGLGVPEPTTTQLGPLELQQTAKPAQRRQKSQVGGLPSALSRRKTPVVSGLHAPRQKCSPNRQAFAATPLC